MQDKYNPMTVFENTENVVLEYSLEEGFFEESINVSDLLSDSLIGAEEKIGIINIYGSKVSFICNVFYNKKYTSEVQLKTEDTVIFKNESAVIVSEGEKLQTFKNIYLVRYVLGEKTINEKTGSEQASIDYRFPVQVIRTIPRKLCAYIEIKEDIVLIGMVEHDQIQRTVTTNETNCESLSGENVTELFAQVKTIISKKGYILASTFPGILTSIGIVDYKKYASSIQKFVERYLSPDYIYEKNIQMNGKIYPGVIVDVNHSANTCGIEKNNYEAEFSNDLIDKLKAAMDKWLEEHQIVVAAQFPNILQSIGIQNFKEYAESIEQFVERYLSDKYQYKKNYSFEGKNHPGVIVKRTDVISNDEDKLLLERIPLLVSECDNDNASGPEQKFGVINVCTGKIGFVNEQYVNKQYLKDFELDSSNSVIFELSKAMIEPADIKLKTSDYVYVVSYAINGMIENTKTGKLQPAIDYSIPIKVLKTISRKKCIRIFFQENDICILNMPDSLNTVIEFEDQIRQLNTIISREIDRKGFFHASLFPDFAKKVGLADFRKKAPSVVEFVNQYLVDFELRMNVVINGTKYPGIIVRKGEEDFLKNDSNQEIAIVDVDNCFSETEEQYLEGLFSEKKYDEFLLSDVLEKYKLCDLPINYIEKAINCAQKLLFPEQENYVELNNFQVELIKTPSAGAFIKNQKKKGFFSENIMMECAESSIATLLFPDDAGIIYKLLNDIGFTNAHNDNYLGLTKMFASCVNCILPHLYLIRCFALKSKNVIEEAVAEYCQIVKGLKQSPANLRIHNNERLYYFDRLLGVIGTHFFKDVELPRNLRTNIVSVFFDTRETNRLYDVLDVVDGGHMSLEYRLVDFWNHPEKWTENEFVELIENGINLQLLQKCISQIWDKYPSNEELPTYFLNILTWVIVHNSYTSIDEIIRFTASDGKLQKRILLGNTLERICKLVNEDMQLYALASYIHEYVVPDLEDASLSDNTKRLETEWPNFSEKVYVQAKNRFKTINGENEKQFIELFDVFELDMTHYLKLQEMYSAWYLDSSMLSERSEEKFCLLLDGLFEKKAYYAFVEAYSFYKEEYSDIKSEKYVSALISLRRYSEAITVLQQSNAIDSAYKNVLLIKIIGENFRNNNLSARAYSIFDSSFTKTEATEFLLANFKSTQYPLITSLIALYCDQKDYIKALYLYIIYKLKAENGFTRLYSQFRSKIKTVLGKINNHYDVVELVFYTLPCDEWIPFFKWARMIPIPGFKEYNPTHIFAFFYDKLIKTPDEKTIWIDFLSHLQNLFEKNAWMIVGCETILKKKMAYADTSTRGRGIKTVLQSPSSALPYNLLPMVAQYIMDENDIDICQELANIFDKNEVKERVVLNNIWYTKYLEIINDLREFCYSKAADSGEEGYYALLNSLGVRIELSELAILASKASNKEFLFKQICQSFLQGIYTAEISELLFEGEWDNLSHRDERILNLLKTVYTDETELLWEDHNIFCDEEEICRFKHDCVLIIGKLPDKSGLLTFEENCFEPFYKLKVYSYIFEIVYDQGIYKKNDFEYSDFKDRKSYYAFLGFLTKAFPAQLESNTSWQFFYKKWRYLKWHLASVLLNNGSVDEEYIVDTMKKNGHFDEMFNDIYAPFVEQVRTFWNLESFSTREREQFVFALMKGHMEEFFVQNKELLSKLGEQEKALIRTLVNSLDYREISLGFFNAYKEEIKNSNWDTILLIADCLPIYVQDLFSEIRNACNTREANEIFNEIAYLLTPSEVIKRIVEIDEERFIRNANLLIRIGCARQFVFQIFGSIRQSIVTGNTQINNMQIDCLEQYLAAKEYENVNSICSYLRVLKLCMNGEKQSAQEIMQIQSIENGLPEEWKNEYQRIVQYVSGATRIFRPIRRNIDSSKTKKQKKAFFSFVDRLVDLCSVEKREMSSGEAVSTYKKVCNDKLPVWDRLCFSVELLCNYPQMSQSEKSNLPIPSKYMLILETGLLALEKENALAIDDQLCIVAELYANRNTFSKANESSLIKLSSRFGQLLRVNLSIKNWVKYADIIGEYANELSVVSDYEELKRRILSDAKVLLGAEVSYEERYARLKELQQNFEGLTSSFSINVRNSIERECLAIEDGVRLIVEIVNDKITDGFVYYEITNNGKRVISLHQENIRIIFKQENQPEKDSKNGGILIESITELQSGSKTGGRIPVVLDSQVDVLNVKMSITYTPAGTVIEELVSNTEWLSLKKEDIAQHFTVGKQHRYRVEQAVNRTDMLFGREDKKDDIQVALQNGVMVIYGPSRIGKTSLLNWIRKDLAKRRGNVLTVLFGGEVDNGKESDFKMNFSDSQKNIPWNDNELMSDYLLVQTLRSSLTSKPQRLGKPSSSLFTQENRHQILQIIQDDSMDLAGRFYELNDFLNSNNLELWIMLDEFQQVVRNWETINTYCSFVKVCRMLSYAEDEENSRIKLILCGSDELLQHMVLKDNSIWKKILPAGSSIGVGPLKKDDFYEMLEKDIGIIGSNISYSKSAKDLLYNYTGGVALYGKEICNTVISEIIANPEKYKGRNTLFASDIADATQNLLKRQSSDLDIGSKLGISEIYSNVTANLDEYSDMQYLWYMAKWLSNPVNAAEDGFPEREFTQNSKSLRDKKHLLDSLEIMKERRIIRNISKSVEDEPVYVFQTIFYYYAVLGGIRKLEENKYIFEPDMLDIEDSQEMNPLSLQRIRPYFKDADADVQNEFLAGLAVNAKDKDALKGLIGTSQSGNIFNAETTINQVNIQSITNTLNGIMTTNDPALLFKGIQELPRLSNYLPQLSDDTGNVVVSDESISRAMDNYVADMEESLEGIKTQAVYDDTSNTEILNSASYAAILGVSDDEYEEFMEQYNLPEFFLRSLGFAYQLDELFIKGAVGNDTNMIDFSPVTIMYCKLIECLLKEYHISIYGKSFEMLDTDMRRPENRDEKYKWKDIGMLPVSQQQRLTIGSFVFPLYKKWAIDKLVKVTGKETDEWVEHKKMIMAVKDIRNPSAHGNKDHRISLEQKEAITEMLFSKHGFLRLIELALG